MSERAARHFARRICGAFFNNVDGYIVEIIGEPLTFFETSSRHGRPRENVVSIISVRKAHTQIFKSKNRDIKFARRNRDSEELRLQFRILDQPWPAALGDARQADETSRATPDSDKLLWFRSIDCCRKSFDDEKLFARRMLFEFGFHRNSIPSTRPNSDHRLDDCSMS